MAESPSELQAEIEKLERKHAENPEGRYFVPLANDYRKLGDVERAEALLREGLARHPDYLSAHIVLGRCLADRGVTGEAADEFKYVLSMDPQNLIALRSLGELAVAEGRRDEAKRWYGELIAVDPMNEEARQALEELDAPAPAPAQGVGAETGGGEWWEPAGAGTASGEDAPSGGGGERAAVDAEVGGAYGEMIDLDDTSPYAREDAAAHDDGVVQLHADRDPGAEGEDEHDDLESVEVVTETIAELYARQGLHDRAAGVYRELIRRRGGDPGLERRLAELEAAGEVDQAPAAEGGGIVEDGAADPFAASFVEGFGEPVGEVPAEAASGAPVGVEPEDPDASDVGGAGEEEGAGLGATGAGHAEPGLEPARPGRTIAAYLAGLAAWSPTATTPATSTPARASVEPEVEVETETGASGWTPEPDPDVDGLDSGGAPGVPAAEPWLDAGEDVSAPSSGDAPRLPTEPLEGVDESTRGGDQDTAARAGSPDDAFPWELPAEPGVTEPAAGEDRGGLDAPMISDFMPTAEPTSAPPQAADEDAEAPAIELEDYFPEQEPDSVNVAEPSSPTPPAVSQPGGEEEDDDLESFQAWLRSLKR